MSESYRHGMGFSPEQRQYAKDRAGIGLKTGELAGGKCEFPGKECFNKPEPKVSHMEGVFIAWLDHKTPESIGDVKMNGLLQCETHNAYLDAQQAFQAECLKGERIIYERKIDRGYKGRVKSRNRLNCQKRRR